MCLLSGPTSPLLRQDEKPPKKKPAKADSDSEALQWEEVMVIGGAGGFRGVDGWHMDG